jgi:hypothetical protein
MRRKPVSSVIQLSENCTVELLSKNWHRTTKEKKEFAEQQARQVQVDERLRLLSILNGTEAS